MLLGLRAFGGQVLDFFLGLALARGPLGDLLFQLHQALLGALAARAGGASMATGAARVAFWGVLAMAVTAGVGAALGQAV